jgi:hypothetical protein
LIERNVFGRSLDLNDARLTSLDSICQLLLRELFRLPLPPDRQSHFDPRIEQLSLFVGHLQEIGRIAKSPTRRFQRLALSRIHHIRLLLTSPFAPSG